MAHLTYEESKKRVVYGLILLGIVTLVEVFISLLAKGYIIKGIENYSIVLYTAGLFIAGLSLYKAYFIIFDFMHMKYEVKTLAMSVLLPTSLLIWALIAFFQEGDSWKDRRQQIKQRNERPASDQAPKPVQGMLLPTDTYTLENRM